MTRNEALVFKGFDSDTSRPSAVPHAAFDDPTCPSDAPPRLLDVREPWEADLASIPGSTLIPLHELGARARDLDPAASVVVYCHLGVRSRLAAEHLSAIGFADVRNLAGGIDAWSRSVDPSVERY